MSSEYSRPYSMQNYSCKDFIQQELHNLQIMFDKLFF